VNDTPKTEENVTDSWKAHEGFLKAIGRFQGEIRMRDREVWIDELCLGSPDQPWLRAPLRRDAADLIRHSVHHAEELAGGVKGALTNALQITRDMLKELPARGAADEADVARVNERQAGLEELLKDLTMAASHSPLLWHPRTLTRWYEILSESFVPGNPAVEVRVVTTYLL
jgi:hypothetical protein